MSIPQCSRVEPHGQARGFLRRRINPPEARLHSLTAISWQLQHRKEEQATLNLLSLVSNLIF
jgi:hypothetical protein